MSPEMIGILGVISMLVLMLLRVWIGTVMIFIGFLGYAFLTGWDKALLMVGMEPFRQAANYPLTAIPFFILMGATVAVSGISQDLYKAASKWMGSLRGGLAMATVAACGAFAAVCGDSIATAITMGKIAYPEMKRFNYDDRLAAGAIASGGTLGILIPPSIAFIVYGILTEESVGHMFIAGIIPGLLEILFYIATIFIICQRNPYLGPAVQKVSLKEKLLGLKSVWPMMVIFLAIIIGIYAGIFTPTEAGAIGAFAAIIVTVWLKKLDKEKFFLTAKETAVNTSMLLFLLIGAYIFMRFISLTHLPAFICEFILELPVSRFLILLMILVVYLFLGCFMSSMTVLVLTTPIIYPTILGLGYHPVWWGVIMVRMIEIALITPPIGMNVFALAKTINVSVKTIYRGIFPFLLADLLHVSLLIAVPEISLFLVKMMSRT